jgi:hypothetical protein
LSTNSNFNEGGESDNEVMQVPDGMTEQQFMRQMADEEIALMAMQQDMNRRFKPKRKGKDSRGSENDNTMISINSLGEERSFD